MSIRYPRYQSGKEGYVSEFTLFIDLLLSAHPEIVEDQRIGWAIYWESKVDFGELEKEREGR